MRPDQKIELFRTLEDGLGIRHCHVGPWAYHSDLLLREFGEDFQLFLSQIKLVNGSQSIQTIFGNVSIKLLRLFITMEL
jgi:hypothetical protein